MKRAIAQRPLYCWPRGSWAAILDYQKELLLAGNVTITGQATGVNSVSYDVGTCSLSVSFLTATTAKPSHDRQLRVFNVI